MLEEQKIGLLKDTFKEIMTASMQNDPKADTLFLAFYNGVKDNEELFGELANRKKVQIDEQVANAQKIIDDAPALKAQLDINKK